MKKLPIAIEIIACILFVCSSMQIIGQHSSEFTKVREIAGIEEYHYSKNDLTVLLMEDHSAPVVTFQVTYHVGSANEVPGVTGATHLLEHLLFKRLAQVQQGRWHLQ